MSFFSLPFVLLLCAAVILYYAMPKKARWLVLLAVSAAFYASGGLTAVLSLLFVGATTYAAGLILTRLGKGSRGVKRLTLTVCLVCNFGFLFAVKYWNFTAAAIAEAGGPVLPAISILPALGLSFYMFQCTGYVIDCYRGKYEAQKNPLKYLLFVSFFPQTVQGPISRYNELGPQLTEGHAFDAENLRAGIQLAVYGYLKKLIIADRAAVIVRAVFSSQEQYGGAVCAFGVLFYCIQLYCDFSGGIDVTRGAARMFGIDMAENFRRPIFATSLADYWRRWHITLGAWMRDYVFYPLSFSKPLGAFSRAVKKRISGRAGKVIPAALATFVVYLFIGIWHGANFRYIFFGLFNGTIMTVSLLLAHSFSKWRQALKISENSRAMHAFRLCRTAAIVFVGRYMTRAPRLLVAFSMLKRTVLSPCLYQLADGTVGALGLGAFDFAAIALGVAAILVIELQQERGVKIRQSLSEKSAFIQWAAIFVPLLILLLQTVFSGEAVDASLIYQQF